jgi:N-acetylglucosaminyl-diphospho-decaprenol L-rhamnosyltransferase
VTAKTGRLNLLSVELSIIIVNWNAGAFLRGCIRSIIHSPPKVSWEIIVIDNASTDGSTEWLKTEYTSENRSQIRLLENSENLGFGRANNQAFELSNAPMVLLLNPDTEVTPGAIDRLIDTLSAEAATGACGPRLINPDGSVQISVWRNPPSAWEILLSQLKLYLLLPRRIRGELLLGGHWDHNRQRRVPMLSGAAILARREMIDEVGGFDERFHVYGEDNEWCLRIIRAGWRLVFEPSAVILHHGAQSASQRWTDLQKLGVQLEASYVFQKHTLPRGQLIANQLANVLTSSAQHLWRRMRGIDAPHVGLARQIHCKHLRRALNDN